LGRMVFGDGCPRSSIGTIFQKGVCQHLIDRTRDRAGDDLRVCKL
jgi:hypothetical protein